MAEIIHGDCRDVLAGLSRDVAIISDPPYGVAERTKRLSAGRSNAAASYDFPPVHGDDQPFDPSPLLRFRYVALCGGNHFASRLPDSPRWLVWDKREGGTPDDNADCEIVWTNGRGPARLFHHKWRGMIKASERGVRREHPTQKPVALMRWIIEQMRLPADCLVVDPYAGSGTTGVAAIALGLPFLGIERDAAYVATARRRIADAQAQITLEGVA